MRAFLLSLLLLCLACAASAQGNLGSASNPILVGVSQDMPFAKIEKNQAIGLAPRIWQLIAQEHGWHYRYVPLGENVEQGIQALKNKRIDLLIGPISVNHERIKSIDYSRPFFINQIGVATTQNELNFWRAVHRIASHFISPAAIGLVLFVLLMAHLLWLLERKKDSDEIPSTYWKGVCRSLWHLFVYLVSYNCFLSPKSKALRVFIVFWFTFVFLTMIIVTSSITAFMTTDLLTSHSGINSKRDVIHQPLAYVEGRQNNRFIRAAHGIPVKMPSLEFALQQLSEGNGNIIGVVEDYMILKDKVETLNLENVKLSNFSFASDEFAFALPYGSPLTRPINTSIVKLQDEERIYQICLSLFPEDAKACYL